MSEGHKDDPVVRAARDQLKAQAIDELRKAEMFAAFVPTKLDDDPGLAFMFSGPTGMLIEMHLILTKQLTAQAAKEFLEGFADDGIHRDVLSDFIQILRPEGGDNDTAD